jgi:hypothetical protein
MEIWKIIWVVSLIVAFLGFVFISSKVIYRGFSEMRDLLRGLDK